MSYEGGLGNEDGMVQLLPEAKQTSRQVFNLFMHVVIELKVSPIMLGAIAAWI